MRSRFFEHLAATNVSLSICQSKGRVFFACEGIRFDRMEPKLFDSPSIFIKRGADVVHRISATYDRENRVFVHYRDRSVFGPYMYASKFPRDTTVDICNPSREPTEIIRSLERYAAYMRVCKALVKMNRRVRDMPPDQLHELLWDNIAWVKSADPKYWPPIVFGRIETIAKAVKTH